MNWIHDTLPDDELLVLVRVQDEEYPIHLGFHEDGEWHYDNAATIDLPVLGWMDLHDAAQTLDHAPALQKAVRELCDRLPLEPYQLDAYVMQIFLPTVKEAIKTPPTVDPDTARLDWLAKHYVSFTLEFPTLRGNSLRERIDQNMTRPTWHDEFRADT